MIRVNDYVEMEVRVNGEWKKVDVLKTLSDGTCMYLIGDKTSDGSYYQGACVPGESYRDIVVAPKTETRVKSAVEIMAILAENDYEIDGDGDWKSPDGDYFFTYMWKWCGKTLHHDDKRFLPEWLDEVEL